MKNKIPFFSRLLLGLMFFVFGLNGFLNFIPQPPTMPEKTVAFLNGIMSTGYFFPFLKGTEVAVGIMLLTGIAAPVALVILAPITIQIILFHGILTPGIENLVMPLAILILHLLSASGFWNLYRPLFGRK